MTKNLPTSDELSKAREGLIKARDLAKGLRAAAIQSLETGSCVVCGDKLSDEKKRKYRSIRKVSEMEYWNYSDALMKIPKSIFDD